MFELFEKKYKEQYGVISLKNLQEMIVQILEKKKIAQTHLTLENLKDLDSKLSWQEFEAELKKKDIVLKGEEADVITDLLLINNFNDKFEIELLRQIVDTSVAKPPIKRRQLSRTEKRNDILKLRRALMRKELKQFINDPLTKHKVATT